jgi:hypothetical protein
VGDSFDPDRWGSISGVAPGTTSTPANFTDNTLSFNASASADDVVLAGVGGVPTAGTVSIELGFMAFAPPVS